MNDRVSEIAKIAMLETSKSFSDRWDRVPRHEFMAAYNQKFTELLVLECVEVLRLVPYDSIDIDFGEERPYQDAIRKHFGVNQ